MVTTSRRDRPPTGQVNTRPPTNTSNPSARMLFSSRRGDATPTNAGGTTNLAATYVIYSSHCAIFCISNVSLCYFVLASCLGKSQWKGNRPIEWRRADRSLVLVAIVHERSVAPHARKIRLSKEFTRFRRNQCLRTI